jgi:hypothetical protein
MRQVVAILERASDAWHNGDLATAGPLHWPIALNLASPEEHSLVADGQVSHRGGTGFQGDEGC